MAKIGGLVGKAGVVRALQCAADEPVSSLDVSGRAAITIAADRYSTQSRDELLVISHVLGLVRYMVGRVVVMYLGQVMESGTTEEVFLRALESVHRSAPFCDPPRRCCGTAIAHRAEIPSALPRRADVPSTLVSSAASALMTTSLSEFPKKT